MRHRNRLLSCVIMFGLAALLAGCPNPSPATRDGGIACTTTSACNPAGQVCGTIRLCVQGFCAENSIVQACSDGAYPDSGSVTGDCLSYEECNPGQTCGSLVSCIDFHCDRTGPRIDIPCPDGGGTDAGPRFDATLDTGVDAASSDAGGSDDASGDAVVLVDTPPTG